MEVKTGEIQAIAAESWVARDYARKESQVIPPVSKSEGGRSRKVGDHKGGDTTSSTTGRTSEEYVELAEKVQGYLKEDLNIDLDFTVEEKTGDMVIKVLNRDTGEVVRQIPPEYLQELRAKLEELRGVLFDDKV